MIAVDATHMSYTSDEMPSFLERATSIPLYVKDVVKRRDNSKKISSLPSNDIVLIEGTLSVAF